MATSLFIIKKGGDKMIKEENIVTVIAIVIIIAIWFVVSTFFFSGFLSAAVIVPAGETGVYHLFGKVKDDELHSGFHLKNPLASVQKMSIRTEEYTMSIALTEGEKEGNDSIDALTKEGLKVAMDLTVLYRLEENKASDVYRELGVDYEDKIIRPQIRSTIREVVSLYSAKDLYSDKRQEVEDKIFEEVKNSIEDRGVIVEKVLLRNIVLPEKLTRAISDKLEMEQQAQKMEFVLEKEEKEAERKTIEAEGIKKSQDIISRSLTPAYVRWYSIEMMKQLANSQNTTFLFVPMDDQGMPVVNFPITK